ncbi:MAG: hypothetical protein IKZ28_00250, partial [Clostridia bacterium]|nr:hypothetical protein [Clostridia bacterium]
MRRTNKKLLTLMITGALCATTMGIGAMGMTTASAEEAAAKKYAITEVFKTSGATLSAEKIGEETAETTTFTFKKETDGIEFNRDLAYKWYEAGVSKYLNFEFAFKALNFTETSFVFQTSPAQATEKDVAENTIKFVKGEGDVISVVIVNGETEQTAVAMNDITAGSAITVALGEGAGYGEFAVTVNGVAVGSFKNVGANYADTAKVDTLVVKAKGFADENGSVVYFDSLNGQAFNNIVTESEKKMVTDTAAPVLVVNDEIGGFLLGTAFSLDYETMDVLKSGTITETKQYYQWNPADTEAMKAEDANAVDTGAKYSAKLTVGSSGTYFMDTVYYTNGTEYSKTAKEGFTATSVYRVEEKEYVSIRIQLDDGSFKGANAEYFLDWYANDEAKASKVLKDANGADVATTYLIFDRNEEGAVYENILADSGSKTNTLV